MGTDVVTLTVIIEISLICALANVWVSPDRASWAPMSNSEPASSWAVVSGVIVPNGQFLSCSVSWVVPYERITRAEPFGSHSLTEFLVRSPPCTLEEPVKKPWGVGLGDRPEWKCHAVLRSVLTPTTTRPSYWPRALCPTPSALRLNVHTTSFVFPSWGFCWTHVL